MFNVIKWYKELEEKRKKEAHREGFAWALGEYFSGRMCSYDIEMLCDVSGVADLGRDFDYGVRDACRLIAQLKLTGDLQYFNKLV